MTVKELIKLLVDLNVPNHKVVVSSDPEGNRLSPLADDYSIGRFENGEIDTEAEKKRQNAVVLWPT